MNRKMLSMFLVLVLFLTVLAGCSKDTNLTVNKESTSPTSTANEAIQQKSFTFLTDSNPSFPYNKDWAVWNFIKEKTGVTLDIQVPANKIEDTLSLDVASATLPDMIFSEDKSLADKYGQQGAFVNILDYVQDMPNFKKWMDNNPTAVQAAKAADGKMYVIPNQGISETDRMNWMYREDIFKKNGLNVPENWDELYTVLKKLKQIYPDSYPLSFRNGLRVLRNFSPSFGTYQFDDNYDMYYDFDKKVWLFGPTQDNYKKLITYLNKFYKEGLIPPDFLSIDTKKWQEIMSTNKAFVTIDYIGRIDGFNTPLRKENPQFNLLFMSPPAGEPGGIKKNAFTQFDATGIMISSKSKQIKDVMKFIDYYYSEEGKTLLSWGKEGVTYNVVNGKKKFISEYLDVTDLRKKTGLSSDGAFGLFDYDSHISLSSPELQSAYEQARKFDSQPQPRPAFTDQENQTISIEGVALKKLREQNIAKFILGENDLKNWDKYVSDMNKNGSVDKLTKVFTDAYNRSAKTAK